MTREARPRSRWRPVLLSGLVLPGLGQLVTGHPWRALFFSAPSLALVVAVVARVMRETQRLMPADPVALLDPMLPLTLAVEIHRANASFFFWATLGILALWAGSIVDTLRDSVGPIPKGSDRNRHRSEHLSGRGPEG
jgi:hypothetical protein